MSTFKANNHAWDGTVQVLSSNDFSRDFQLPGEEIKETEKHDAGNERKFNDAEAKKMVLRTSPGVQFHLLLVV